MLSSVRSVKTKAKTAPSRRKTARSDEKAGTPGRGKEAFVSEVRASEGRGRGEAWDGALVLGERPRPPGNWAPESTCEDQVPTLGASSRGSWSRCLACWGGFGGAAHLLSSAPWGWPERRRHVSLGGRLERGVCLDLEAPGGLQFCFPCGMASRSGTGQSPEAGSYGSWGQGHAWGTLPPPVTLHPWGLQVTRGCGRKRRAVLLERVPLRPCEATL